MNEILIINMIYLCQIGALVITGAMIWRARKMFNGFARGLMLLIGLLIVRRIDDATDVIGPVGIAVISTLVVVVLLLDVYNIYHDRRAYMARIEALKKRQNDLEELRAKDEQAGIWEKQDEWAKRVRNIMRKRSN